jgi:hypothetical protein
MPTVIFKRDGHPRTRSAQSDEITIRDTILVQGHRPALACAVTLIERYAKGRAKGRMDAAWERRADRDGGTQPPERRALIRAGRLGQQIEEHRRSG